MLAGSGMLPVDVIPGRWHAWQVRSHGFLLKP